MMKLINSHLFSNFSYTQIIFLLIILPVIANGGVLKDVVKPAGSIPDIGKTLEYITKAGDLSKTLDSTDKNAQHDYSPPGMPTMPIECENMENNGCAECYKDAYEELNDLRRYFEQLRAIYVETDQITKAGIALGDSIAGSAGVAGLEWMAQRSKIQNSFKTFKKAYKKKNNELLSRLEKVLQEIAKCEDQYFGNKDWYSRYGFIFVSFMALHYAR